MKNLFILILFLSELYANDNVLFLKHHIQDNIVLSPIQNDKPTYFINHKKEKKFSIRFNAREVFLGKQSFYYQLNGTYLTIIDKKNFKKNIYHLEYLYGNCFEIIPFFLKIDNSIEESYNTKICFLK